LLGGRRLEYIMSRVSTILCAALGFVALMNTLSADTIKLTSGGTVRGQILDEKSTKESLVVKLQIGGGEVTIERDKIQEVIRDKGSLAEYDQIKADYADTADDQFRLAMWCEKQKLYRQRKQHLDRVIELEPDHAAAREKLGYLRHEGKWLTRDQQQEAKGLVRFGGRFVTPQEREILEKKKREESVVRDWHQRVKMWKGWLTSDEPAKARDAEQQLRTIDDPRAMDALVNQFGKEKEESRRVMMCEIVGGLPGEQATLELVKRCIMDMSADVRWAAVEALVEREDAEAVRALMKILTSEHNTVVRRAADALGALEDSSAVPALIDALVTKHKQVVTRNAPGSFMGVQTPTIVDFEPVVASGVVAFNPVIGYQAQGAGFTKSITEVVVVPVENPEVLGALTAITDQDFGYDKAAWRRWLAGQKQRDELKNRRPLDD
jgi:hypothetical protein